MIQSFLINFKENAGHSNKGVPALEKSYFNEELFAFGFTERLQDQTKRSVTSMLRKSSRTSTLSFEGVNLLNRSYIFT